MSLCCVFSSPVLPSSLPPFLPSSLPPSSLPPSSFLLKEFWMTGDNNGRWAGNYSWPDSHTLYMSHVRDAIRMLRIHPSLLFWNGCNECYPASRIWYGEPLAASVE